MHSRTGFTCAAAAAARPRHGCSLSLSLLTCPHVPLARVMFLFGVVVVLLLLNLLIARFAKTFDVVYENVDCNFKVAFARVVIEASAKEILPPPLNILRLLMLRALRAAQGFARSLRVCDAFLQAKSPVSRLRTLAAARRGLLTGPSSPMAGLKITGRARSRAHKRLVEEDEEVSNVGEEEEANGDVVGGSRQRGEEEAREDALGMQWVDERVREYIEHALKQPGGDGLTDQVVQFVCRHMHDVG